MTLRISRPWAVILYAAALSASCVQSGPREEGPAAEGKPEANSGIVEITPAAVTAGGIASEEASLRPAVRRIAASGELAFNPRRAAHLSARVSGRLEHVLAFKGDRVSAGQVLAEIYSPDYLALQAEYLQASERAARLRGGEDEAAARSFLEAARQKLLPLGATEADLERLAAAKTLAPLLAVRSPLAATVIATDAVEGDRVGLETEMFQLADLTSLWAELRLYEKDLAALRPGLEAVLQTQAYPGEEFRGRLVRIGDVMDDKTRTIEGRVEIANPSGRLKPGMYVEGALSAPEGRPALYVPETALQQLRDKTVVFIEEKPGRYRLREVEAAGRAGGLVEIVRGLAAGERVVTTGSFLIKSEMLKGTLEE